VASLKDIKIRILTHVDDGTRAIIDGLLKSHTNIEVRPLQQTLQTRLTTLIADRKDNLHGTIGLATYSNIESTVWTHTSIFETLWMQAEIEENKKLDSKLSNGSPKIIFENNLSQRFLQTILNCREKVGKPPCTT
jgi:hypothetical protein